MTHDRDPLTVLTPSTFDPSIRAQDDLFRHVNGPWLQSTEIPADKPSTGAFMILRDQAEEAVREIITGVDRGEPGSVESKVADLYASFMDQDRIESLGAEPLREDFALIEGVKNIADLQQLFGTFLVRGIGSVVGVDTDADPGDPTHNLVFIGQSGIGLPDEEYYRDPAHAQIRDQYRAHVERMFGYAGFADAAEQAQKVIDLETEIAAHHWDKVEVRDLNKMYNPFSWAELQDSTQNLDWSAVLIQGMGLPETAVATVVNAQPSFFSGLDQLLVPERLDHWMSWARWRVITSRASYLSSDFVNENFAFYGTVLSGTPELKERWKRGVGLVNGVLGEAVGKLYVDQHFSPTAKKRMDDLVANLLAAYRRSIESLEWMTDTTRAEALKKLAAFTPKIGYPDQWKDYSSLHIQADDLVGNIVRTSEFNLADLIRKAGKPVEKHEWLMTPQTVNAYYHPLRNEIVFPAAILQPPFFDENAEDAVNYGAIGAVIGHEIGHGFDDKGSTCDGDGRLRNWWSDQDRAAFEERTSALVSQYDGLVPEQLTEMQQPASVNGRMTLGENIGDLGGLSIAYKAWEFSHQHGNESSAASPDDSELTPAQKLFLSWAFVWQQKARDETVTHLLTVDVHSPNEFRANQTARNVDAFHEAFGVTENDRMWLAPEDRVRIW